jgi:hypothetical protein
MGGMGPMVTGSLLIANPAHANISRVASAHGCPYLRQCVEKGGFSCVRRSTTGLNM